MLHNQKLRLLAPEVAFKLTAFPDRIELSRFMLVVCFNTRLLQSSIVPILLPNMLPLQRFANLSASKKVFGGLVLPPNLLPSCHAKQDRERQ